MGLWWDTQPSSSSSSSPLLAARFPKGVWLPCVCLSLLPPGLRLLHHPSVQASRLSSCGASSPRLPSLSAFFPPFSVSFPPPFPSVLSKLEPDDRYQTCLQEIKRGGGWWWPVRPPPARSFCIWSQPCFNCSCCWLCSLFSWQRGGGMCFSLSFLAGGDRGKIPLNPGCAWLSNLCP